MEYLRNMTATYSEMSKRSQTALITIVVVTVVVLFAVSRAAIHTDWQTIQSGMRPEMMGKSKSALEGAGIKFRLAESGTAMEVANDDISQARVALADAGALGSDSHASYEQILDKKTSPIGMTQEQYKLTRQRLLEGLIANDIERINGIEAASVRLTMPEDELFTDKESKPTAAVSVETLGNGLSDMRVRAIAQITASAVKDMKPVEVSIVDEEGQLYNNGESSGIGADGSFTGPQMKLEVENRYNRNLEAELTSKMEEIAGVGKVKITSGAELDLDNVTEETKTFGRGDDGEQGPVRQETTDDESLNSAGGTAAGVAGTPSNTGGTGTTSYGADSGETGTGDYNKAGKTAIYDNDMVAAITKRAPGAVKAHHIGVTIHDKLPAETQAAIENAIRARIGANPEHTIDFSTASIPEADDSLSSRRKAEERRGVLLTRAKWTLLGLGLIALAFFLRRSLNQRMQELLEPTEDMLFIESGYDPIPLKELEAAVNAASSMENQKRVEMQRRVEGIVAQKPENVAMMLRGWLHDETMQGGKRAS